ncbi:MAG: DUF3575 domain-containing protein [Candidatus Pedobacter colombiensis]|uniref:DUF3575 domain-containing protein n=1 Tax=Candidatus Pedobacter colombiensis TaxID=3121371 RepID=A0AAJ5WCK5_9SPHI|nr:DUF3575 domain-containing protein [Pedobacter sp.]WEK21085.1 MAG: DUF3575 domain-containing protein [Pedobacter sp.]
MQKNFTKNLLLSSLVLIFCSAGTINAQEKTKTTQETSSEAEGKNLVKWNVAALAMKNYSFQYERAVSKKIAVALGVRFAPKSGVPFKSQFEKLIDNEDTWNSIKDFKTGNFAVTPEVRFYLGQSVFRGFYIAPFARYAKYSAEVPYNYEVTVGTITQKDVMPLSGDVTTFTGGVLFGAQWKLSKLVYLDWWILGPNYGTSSGSISGKKTLSPEEQNALRDQLKDLEDLPLVKTKSTVNGEGAKVDFDGPWAGLRSGLSIGFRF